MATASDWPAISRAFAEARRAGPEPEALRAAWREFERLAKASESEPPYHLRVLLAHLERCRGDRPRGAIGILEHGCGGGSAIFYLAALGFTDVHGVDVGGDMTVLNRVAAEILGHAGSRFHVYDGGRLPLRDESIDFVFSEQVLEHVADDVFDAYYREEARVLRPGGMAVHQVPHRLVPYDSHTKTWLIHYLPAPFYRALAIALGRPVPSHLHLRWPWVHRQKLRDALGSCRDTTLDRFLGISNPAYYDGSVRLRALIVRLMSLPVLGAALRGVLRHFLMIETVAIKRAA